MTATATSSLSKRGWRGPAIGAVALLLATACGGAGAKPGPFTWLSPRPAPSGWSVATVPSGAKLAYPPGWRQIRGDAGTATAVLMAGPGNYLGYLNVTPRQGDETVAGWASFRVEHNGEEGDRHVKRLASATGLHFLDGSGSCVKDAYTTSAGRSYVEIACIVSASSRASVIVAAAQPSSWARVSPQLERAISGFRA